MNIKRDFRIFAAIQISLIIIMVGFAIYAAVWL